MQDISTKRWAEVKVADEAALEELRTAGATVITFDDATLDKLEVTRTDVWPKISGELGAGYDQLKAAIGAK